MKAFERKLVNHLLTGQATSVGERIKNIAMVFVLNVLWVILLTYFLKWLHSGGEIIFVPAEQIAEGFRLVPIYVPPVKWEIFFACILAPLWEELAFRYAPYKIAQNLDLRLGNTNSEILLPVIAISTIMFGWGHGEGPISILVQGVAGIGLTYTYIKNGFNYWSSVGLHCMWNSMCVFIDQVV